MCIFKSTYNFYFIGPIFSDTERMGQIFDWDGTITGKPRHFVVRDQPFYTSSLCEPKPNWGNMSICPHRYVDGAGTGAGFAKIGRFLLREALVVRPLRP